MTPRCCQNCEHLGKEGGCVTYGFKKCSKWRSWFRENWEDIRRAAEQIKKKRQKEEPKNDGKGTAAP